MQVLGDDTAGFRDEFVVQIRSSDRRLLSLGAGEHWRTGPENLRAARVAWAQLGHRYLQVSVRISPSVSSHAFSSTGSFPSGSTLQLSRHVPADSFMQ